MDAIINQFTALSQPGGLNCLLPTPIEVRVMGRRPVLLLLRDAPLFIIWGGHSAGLESRGPAGAFLSFFQTVIQVRTSCPRAHGAGIGAPSPRRPSLCRSGGIPPSDLAFVGVVRRRSRPPCPSWTPGVRVAPSPMEGTRSHGRPVRRVGLGEARSRRSSSCLRGSGPFGVTAYGLGSSDTNAHFHTRECIHSRPSPFVCPPFLLRLRGGMTTP